MSDQMDHTPVVNYGARGVRLWSLGVDQHGRWCRCLTCADTRAYLGKPPLIGEPPAPAAQREERAAS